MGKTAVFVLSILQQLDENPATASALILCNTRELAYQIKKEFDRFTKYLPNLRKEVFFGGQPYHDHAKIIKGVNAPHIIIGTPGRILALCQKGDLNLDKLQMFVLDECDKMLDETGKQCKIYFYVFFNVLHFNFIFCRHACSGTKDLHDWIWSKIGYDVLSHNFRQMQRHLQNVHERPI